MSFTPPDETPPVIWSDLPSTASPLDAANLNAEEVALISDVQETVTAYDAYAQNAFLATDTPLAAGVNIISGVGNLSGTYALDLSTANLTIVGAATLTGDTAVPVTGYSAGSQGQLNVTETGGHALSIIANGQTLPLTIPPSGACVVEMSAMDGNLFVDVTAANVMVGSQLPLWSGTIAALVSGQLDTTVWPYQSIAAGHLTVLTDPLGTQGTVLEFAITETG